jgi:glucuronate isomerase
MTKPLILHAERLMPANADVRAIAIRLYRSVKDLPIVSPHGHTDPAWFANNQPFGNATELLIKPDHYVFRMLFSQGISLEALGIASQDGSLVESDDRKIWHIFARHYYLFAGTPSRLWLDHVFVEVFGIKVQLSEETADYYLDHINQLLATEAFLPRSLFERFNIEYLATTESPLDDLRHHQAIRASGWRGKVLTAYRPDNVIDPEYENFSANIQTFGQLTGCDTSTWGGYLEAHRVRRKFFASMGATSTDHGHPTATTANLSLADSEALFRKVLSGNCSPAEAETFRGQMLTEMAGMSIADGLVMQIHPGSFRNHNDWVFRKFGRDKGADIPSSTDYVGAMKPLLDKYGNNASLSIILFTLDETVYSRELAPLAGHYPCLKLGPPWWFHDSPEGMRRFRQQTTETAGIYNTAGFNDDTRAFLSIPARHDVARRMDCSFLAEMVADHRIDESEALALAEQMAYRLAKQTYRFSE